MDPRTTKDTIGCRVAARTSVWFVGGLLGTGRRVKAKVETKIALTPIGPISRVPDQSRSRM